MKSLQTIDVAAAQRIIDQTRVRRNETRARVLPSASDLAVELNKAAENHACRLEAASLHEKLEPHIKSLSELLKALGWSPVDGFFLRGCDDCDPPVETDLKNDLFWTEYEEVGRGEGQVHVMIDDYEDEDFDLDEEVITNAIKRAHIGMAWQHDLLVMLFHDGLLKVETALIKTDLVGIYEKLFKAKIASSTMSDASKGGPAIRFIQAAFAEFGLYPKTPDAIDSMFDEVKKQRRRGILNLVHSHADFVHHFPKHSWEERPKPVTKWISESNGVTRIIVYDPNVSS